MRIVGIRRDGGVQVAALSDDGAQVTVVAGLEEFWADAAGHLSREPDGEPLGAADLEFVPPVLPGARVVCIGLNYLKHVAEGSFRDQEIPPHPTLFARWTQSLTVGGAEVPVPSNEDGLDWEGEVMAYVGSTLVDATPDEALAAVVGYSTFNDLTSRRAQKLTSQWILGKNGDRSGPLGPIVPAAEVGDLRDGLRVQTRVNGETVQDGRTDEMVKVKGVKLYPSEIRAVLLGLDGPTGGYRITVAAKDSGGDRLTLTLAGKGGGDVTDEIARRFKSQTLISADDIVFEDILEDGPAVVDQRS